MCGCTQSPLIDQTSHRRTRVTDGVDEPRLERVKRGQICRGVLGRHGARRLVGGFEQGGQDLRELREVVLLQRSPALGGVVWALEVPGRLFGVVDIVVVVGWWS